MNFAKWVFWLAGAYGLCLLIPQLFMEAQISKDQPPAITHPEFFYGFTGVAIAWQVAFLVMGSDPARYRPMILPSIVEKASFGLAAWWLFAQGRVAPFVAVFGTLDLVWGALFVAAYVAIGPRGIAKNTP